MLLPLSGKPYRGESCSMLQDTEVEARSTNYRRIIATTKGLLPTFTRKPCKGQSHLRGAGYGGGGQVDQL